MLNLTMLQRYVIAASLVCAASAGAQPFTLRAFDEWVVACDNIGRCSLLNMGPLAQARAQRRPPARRASASITRPGRAAIRPST